jgi:hypothetical protein
LGADTGTIVPRGCDAASPTTTRCATSTGPLSSPPAPPAWGREAGFRGLDATRPQPVARDLTFRSIAGTVWNAWFCAVTTDGATYCFNEKP